MTDPEALRGRLQEVSEHYKNVTVPVHRMELRSTLQSIAQHGREHVLQFGPEEIKARDYAFHLQRNISKTRTWLDGQAGPALARNDPAMIQKALAKGPLGGDLTSRGVGNSPQLAEYIKTMGERAARAKHDTMPVVRAGARADALPAAARASASTLQGVKEAGSQVARNPTLAVRQAATSGIGQAIKNNVGQFARSARDNAQAVLTALITFARIYPKTAIAITAATLIATATGIYVANSDSPQAPAETPPAVQGPVEPPPPPPVPEAPPPAGPVDVPPPAGPVDVPPGLPPQAPPGQVNPGSGAGSGGSGGGDSGGAGGGSGSSGGGGTESGGGHSGGSGSTGGSGGSGGAGGGSGSGGSGGSDSGHSGSGSGGSGGTGGGSGSGGSGSGSGGSGGSGGASSGTGSGGGHSGGAGGSGN